MKQDKQLMGFVAVALAAVLAIYLSAVPSKPTQQQEDIPAITAAATSEITPAAGDVLPGSMGDLGKAGPFSRIYATEGACRDLSGLSCRYVMCPQGITSSSDTTDVTRTICHAGEGSGWRPTLVSP